MPYQGGRADIVRAAHYTWSAACKVRNRQVNNTRPHRHHRSSRIGTKYIKGASARG